MKVIKIIFIVLFLLASMVGVTLGAGYLATNNPFDNSHKHELVAVEESEPTCATPGYRKHYVCTGCNEIFSDKGGFGLLDPAQVIIAPLGHDIGITSCTEAKVCKTCMQTVSEAPGHVVVVDAAIAPTCTEEGLTEGSHCSVCGEVLVAQIIARATGHSYDSKDDFNCNDCSYVRSEDECPHIKADMVSVVTTPPTCTKAGYTTYTCICNAIIIGDEVPAMGHTAGKPEIFKAPTDNEIGEIHINCENCDYYDVVQLPVVLDGPYTKVSTNGCISTWKYIYGDTELHFDTFSTVTYTFEAENSELSGNIKVTEGENCTYVDEIRSKVSAGMKFSVTSHREAEVTFIISLGTTQTIGLHRGANTLTVNGEKITLNEVTTTPGDSYTDFKEYTIATFTLKEGSNTVEFYHKGGSGAAIYAFGNVDYFKLIAAANLSWTVTTPEHTHELTEVSEVAATCTAAGTKAYYKCSGCEKIFADKDGAKEIAAPEAIAALDHSFTNYVSYNNATCEADGTETAKCDRCDETNTRTVADSKLGHDYGTAWAFDANGHWYVCANGCNVKGSEAAHTPNIDNATETDAKICTECEYVIEAALGHKTHNYNLPKYDATHHWNQCYGCNEISEKVEHTYSESIVNDSTCNATGTKKLTCTCGYSKEEEIPVKDHSFVVKTVSEDTRKSAADCNNAAVYYFSCACGAISTTETFEDGTALGHTTDDVEMFKAPTYDEVGELRINCDNCDYYEAVQLPVVSEGSYTKLSSNGYTSTWKYVYGEQEFTFEVKENTQKYTFDVNTDKNPFASANGGKVVANGVELTGPTTEDDVDFYYYGNDVDYNTNYTLTIYADEATTVRFIIFGAKKNSKTYATSTLIKSLTINGESTGVTYSTTALKFGNTTADWHKYKELEIATLSLKQGYNTITFTIKESLNIKALIIESAVPVDFKANPVTE